MNKLEKEHLEAIEDTLTNKSNKILATSCASITKEYAMLFANWLIKEKLMLGASKKYEDKTPHELWDIFLNDLNEKG